MLDIVIISVPGTTSQTAPAAPALLKASIQQAGFTCRTIDFNIRLYKDLSNVGEIEAYFSTGLNTDQHNAAGDLIKKWAAELVKLNPRYIGISVFTYQNRVATRMFCEEIKKHSNIKIVLGGQGLSDGGINGMSNFGQQLVKLNLADHWIRSEGEISLVQLLRKNFQYPGIDSNTFEQVNNLDSIPYPNYDDYQFDDYESNVIPITASRGCVRSCSFCDIHEHWKYRYRTGQNIANEIMHLHQTYKITQFRFTDSLVNGNLKEFRNLIKILAEYNITQTKKITWRGQFIVRSEKNVDQEYWKNLANSGAYKLAIGVETGSDTVRSHMNKQFNSADLDYTMSMLNQYNITCVFLMIVGYPTETDQDFQETLDLFVKYKPLANRIIKGVNVGSTLGILPGTPLYNNADLYNIELDKYENNWVSHDNPDLTLDKRLDRRNYLKQHLLDIGYLTTTDENEHVLAILESKKELFAQRRKLKKLIKIKSI